MMSGGRGNDERGKQLVVVSSASYDSPQVAATEASHIYHAYPPPLAKYEDVARDPKLFMETLEKLHTIMGTKFMSVSCVYLYLFRIISCISHSFACEFVSIELYFGLFSPCIFWGCLHSVCLFFFFF